MPMSSMSTMTAASVRPIPTRSMEAELDHGRVEAALPRVVGSHQAPSTLKSRSRPRTW
jgi:hypothetical protein